MRFFIFLLVALALGGAGQLCVAQGFYYLAPPKVRVALPAGQHVVAHVVDARLQRASLGLVARQGGLQLATFREGLPATLQAFFAKYAYADPGAKPLVMRLTNLEIAETNTSLVETATAGLVANFYAQQPDSSYSSYRLVAHFAQIQERAALDVTGQHPGTIGELLLAAVALARERAAGAPTGPTYSLPRLLDPQPLPSETLAVLDPATLPQPGYYHTISEFWHNQPSEPGQPTGEIKTAQGAEWAGDKHYKPYRTNAQGRYEPVTDVWGFCDGQNYYVRSGPEFYLLKRSGANFDFFGSAGTNPALHTAVNILGVATMATAGMGVFSTNGEHRVLYHLNLLTGTFSLNQTNSAVTTTVASRPTHLFIYRPRNAKGPAVRVRLAEDQPAQELAAGEYLTFEPASDAPLRVCLLPATGAPVYLAITPTAEAPTYLECSPGSPEPLRKVKDAAGAAALTRLVR